MEKDVNDKLMDLYSGLWPDFCKAMKSITANTAAAALPTNPLLLFVKDDGADYEKADLRVVVFGRENNDWGGTFSAENIAPREEIDRIQEIYNGYFNYGDGSRKIFMHGMEKFMSRLREKCPGRTIEYVWNNIVKIGKARIPGQKNAIGIPPQQIQEVEMQYFPVVEEELRILKPDVVLFLTGPSYDPVIVKRIQGVTFSPLTSAHGQEIARVEIPGVKWAYRTFHPRGFMYKGKGTMDAYFDAIIEDILCNLKK